jgi:putative aldouronate transport system substrate-binding protein
MFTELLAPLPSEAKYKTELDKMVEEAYIRIITGESPLGYFDEFVRNWHSAGGSVLEKEANEWWTSTRR